MKTFLIGVFILVLFCCCNLSEKKEDISLEQIPSDYPIILRGDTINNRVRLIHNQLAYRIKKNSLSEVRITNPTYYYGGSYVQEEYKSWWGALLISIVNNNEQMEIIGLNDDRRSLDRFSFKSYIFQTKHSPDTAQSVQKKFEPYINRMKLLGKDTLHIGTLQQLKSIDPDLVENLFVGDSIGIDYIKDDLFHRINVSVEMK